MINGSDNVNVYIKYCLCLLMFSLHYVKIDCMTPFDAVSVAHGKDAISVASKLTKALSIVHVLV